MSRYLEMLRKAEPEVTKYEINEICPAPVVSPVHNSTPGRLISLNSYFVRVLSVLESRCPEGVPQDRWQQCIVDGQAFLASWDEQARQLGWSSRDLFGLDTPPAAASPRYARLSRYDRTGLLWLLQGRPVVALTKETAAIESPTGAITSYGKTNKPALGPVGDSLDDL